MENRNPLTASRCWVIPPTPCHMLGGNCLLNFLSLDELLLEGQTQSVIAPGTGWGGAWGTG